MNKHLYSNMVPLGGAPGGEPIKTMEQMYSDLLDSQPTADDGIDVDGLLLEATQAAEGVEQYRPVDIKEKLPRQALGVVLPCLGNNEDGDAELLTKLYSGRLLFDRSSGSWYLWGGHAWVKDRLGVVGRLITGQLAAQYMYAHGQILETADRDANGNYSDNDKATMQQLNQRVYALRGRNRRNNVMAIAQDHMAITGDEWDADPFLLGVKNGVIDLRNGNFRPGKPDDYIRNVCPTPWKGINEPAITWERTLLSSMNDSRDMVGYLQRVFGYAITGSTQEEKMFVMVGAGRNGKDVVFKALGRTLGGGLSTPVSNDVMIASKGSKAQGSASPHIMTLRGKRMVWASETKEGDKLDAGQVKMLTGGGEITARGLYEGEVTFSPTHTLFLMTNAKPHVSADDFAIWQRIKLVMWNVCFVDDPNNPPPETPAGAILKEKDPTLKEILKDEDSGILAWLVRGCLEWQRIGLCEPEAITTATQEYRLEEDTVGRFLSESCETGPTNKVKAQDLYLAYKLWCSDEGENPMSGTAFGAKVGKRFVRSRDGEGRVYRGLHLSKDMASRVEAVAALKAM